MRGIDQRRGNAGIESGLPGGSDAPARVECHLAAHPHTDLLRARTVVLLEIFLGLNQAEQTVDERNGLDRVVRVLDVFVPRERPRRKRDLLVGLQHIVERDRGFVRSDVVRTENRDEPAEVVVLEEFLVAVEVCDRVCRTESQVRLARRAVTKRVDGARSIGLDVVIIAVRDDEPFRIRQGRDVTESVIVKVPRRVGRLVAGVGSAGGRIDSADQRVNELVHGAVGAVVGRAFPQGGRRGGASSVSRDDRIGMKDVGSAIFLVRDRVRHVVGIGVGVAVFRLLTEIGHTDQIADIVVVAPLSRALAGRIRIARRAFIPGHVFLAVGGEEASGTEIQSVRGRIVCLVRDLKELPTLIGYHRSMQNAPTVEVLVMKLLVDGRIIFARRSYLAETELLPLGAVEVAGGLDVEASHVVVAAPVIDVDLCEHPMI